MLKMCNVYLGVKHPMLQLRYVCLDTSLLMNCLRCRGKLIICLNTVCVCWLINQRIRIYIKRATGHFCTDSRKIPQTAKIRIDLSINIVQVFLDSELLRYLNILATVRIYMYINIYAFLVLFYFCGFCLFVCFSQSCFVLLSLI